MCAEGLFQVVELATTSYASRQDLGAHAPHEVKAHGTARMTRRMNLMLAAACTTRRDPAARPDQPYHLGDHGGWVGNVDQQRAGVREVE